MEKSELTLKDTARMKQIMIQSQQQQPQGQCFSVCLAETGMKKKFAVLKFPSCNKVDFTNCPGGAKLERENNLKEFKSAYDIDVLPKFGAGSEYGREQREEARKKKYGIKIKKYNPQDQPWLLKMGTGKQTKRFKGTRNGGVTENASYYIFMPMSDTKFIAQPVDEWYDFIPQAKYKTLNAEEAEEEFNRRDRTLNHFAIMIKKRLNQSENDDDEIGDGKKNKKKKDKSFLVSEFDEMSEDDDDDLDSECDVNKGVDDDTEKKSKIKKDKSKRSKLKKKAKGTDDEAEEESDEMDEGEEVDYMSGSSSDDEGMYDDGKREESETYKNAGVVEEEGLRKLIDSDEDDEEDDNKKSDENEDEDPTENELNSRPKEGKTGKESDSESSSGSDIDNDDNLLFMMPDKKPQTKMSSVGKQVGSGDDKTDVPTETTSNKKRKVEPALGLTAKKVKLEQESLQQSMSTPTSSSDASMEEIVKRYLLRKPTTTRDLLQKLKSKHSLVSGLSRDQLQVCLSDILKKLNPEMNKIEGKMYFFLKPSGQTSVSNSDN